MLLAQAAGFELQIFNAVVQCGSFGVLAYIVIYLGPWLYQRIQDDRQKTLDYFQAHSRDRDEGVDRRFTLLLSALERQQQANEKAVEKLCERNEKAIDKLAECVMEHAKQTAEQVIREVREGRP